MLGHQAHSAANEQTAAALLALVEDCPKAIEICRKPDTGLKKIVEDRLKTIDKNPADEEEQAHLERLMQMTA
jgi:hypothetical protein